MKKNINTLTSCMLNIVQHKQYKDLFIQNKSQDSSVRESKWIYKLDQNLQMQYSGTNINIKVYRY